MEGRFFPREEIKINYGAMKVVPNKPNPVFVGSFREELIKSITDILCSRCKEKLMDKCKLGASPMTGYCGHLFCNNCARELYETNKSEPTPKDTRILDFQVQCDVDSDFLLYECDACKKNININKNDVKLFRKKIEKEKKKKSVTEFFCFMRLFEVNSMLKNLYNALRQPGYLCQYKKKEKDGSEEDGSWILCHKHPLNNSLHCDPCRGNASKPYTCVWHAEKHMKCEYNHMKGVPQKNGLQIIASARALKSLKMDPHTDNDQDIPDNHLATPDRTKRDIYAPFYHCAYCASPLRLHDKDLINRPYHLSCGHLVGVGGCREDAWNQLIERGACCIFCEDKLDRETDVMPFFPLSSTLTAIVVGELAKFPLRICDFSCSKCHFVSCKTWFSSRNNQFLDKKIEICQWCEVEHELLKKTEECN